NTGLTVKVPSLNLARFLPSCKKSTINILLFEKLWNLLNLFSTSVMSSKTSYSLIIFFKILLSNLCSFFILLSIFVSLYSFFISIFFFFFNYFFLIFFLFSFDYLLLFLYKLLLILYLNWS